MLLPNSVEGFSPEMYVAALAEVVRSDGLHAAEIAILEEHAGRFGIDLDRLPALPANLRALPAATRVLVYRDAYMLAMADGEFSEPEATRLGELAGRLGLASAATELIIEWADDYSTLLARFEDLVRGVKEGSEVIDAAATATVRARANIYGNATSESRINHLAQFYTFLERLGEGVGGARLLSQCTGLMAWPRRGVSFFFEPNELRTDSGTGPRVVRVGTHAVAAGSRTTLWNRLSSHRGVAAAGGGNHRGTIFRLLVGTALMRSQLSGAVDTWGQGATAGRETREAEIPLEKQVTSVIGEMPFLWLQVDDEPGTKSQRAYIERNSIGLLSNLDRTPCDPASPAWLGHRCHRPRVRQSGLWNQQHVEDSYDPKFLDVFSRLVDEQLAAGSKQ